MPFAFRLLLGLVLMLPVPSFAIEGPASLCDQAAHKAARVVGVPLDILLAITRAETGRSSDAGVQPWPWAMNQGGPGYWFETKEEVLAEAEAQIANGKSNFDMGCFQLNYRWHAAGFASLDDMVDPESNALYAAKFLKQLYDASGSWPQAISDYHSRTDDLAEVYLARVEALLGGSLDTELADAAPSLQTDLPEEVRVNLFPLLQQGEPGSIGSIVPRTHSRGGLFASNS